MYMEAVLGLTVDIEAVAVVMCIVTVVGWGGDDKFLVIPTLLWRPEERQTKVKLRTAHLVYPSVGRVALFLVDLS